MRRDFITFRSITPAQQAQRVLWRAGVDAVLSRTPRALEQMGCGYCLRLWTQDVRPALEALRTAQVPLRKVYLQARDGQLEEWNP